MRPFKFLSGSSGHVGARFLLPPPPVAARSRRGATAAPVAAAHAMQHRRSKVVSEPLGASSRGMCVSSGPGGLTHIDAKGAPTMVDVGEKVVTSREATARSEMHVCDSVMRLMTDDGSEMRSAKGPVFATAVIAGTMAAKRTHDLIPFCHPLGVEGVKITVQVTGSNTIEIECRVRVTGKTGVEMEALTGASVAALTVYDMCKAVSHDMITKTYLVAKSGGKSDFVKSKLA